MRSNNYKDEIILCAMAGKQVVIRCSLFGKGRQRRGIIICRGPENTKSYWKKCSHGSVRECPALVLQRGVDKEISDRMKAPNTLQDLVRAVFHGYDLIREKMKQ